MKPFLTYNPPLTVYTTREASRLLGIPASTLRDNCQLLGIPKRATQWLFTQDDIDKLRNKCAIRRRRAHRTV